MSSRRQEIADGLSRLATLKHELQKLLSGGQSAIRVLSEGNRHLTRNIQELDSAEQLYIVIRETNLEGLPQTNYDGLVSPLWAIIADSGELTAFDERTNDAWLFAEEFAIAAGSTSTTLSGSVGDTVGRLFCDLDIPETTRFKIGSILNEHNETIDVDHDIDYIKSELPKLEPDVSDDFTQCVRNYYAHGAWEQKYMELMSYRTLFYLKLVEPMARAVARPSSRREQIHLFLCAHSACEDPHARRIATAAYDLWCELSNQKPDALSAKMGFVTQPYVEMMFARAIVTMANALRCRAQARGK